jgi:energy-coupling factor transporter ATP-binding protein EcfA2
LAFKWVDLYCYDAGYQRALQVALAFAGAALSSPTIQSADAADSASAATAAAVVDGPPPRTKQLVLLDEPTGDDMDPALQKTVWGLIRGRHAGATVVVATRSVSEANALADRVALISHGRVKCCGGPTFLRRLFGLGYRLHVSFRRASRRTAVLQNGVGHLPPVQGEASSSSSSGDVSDYSLDVLSLVKRHCPGAEALRGQPADYGNSGITLSLAAAGGASNGTSGGGENDDKNNYNGSGGGGGGTGQSAAATSAAAVRLGPMLADLEQAADRFNIADVALEATSLDEVFAQLGQEAEEESETLLPLDASAVALDFGGGRGESSLGVGLLSATEGDINVDVGGGSASLGGSGGGGGGRGVGGHPPAAAAAGFNVWMRNTWALASCRISGYYRAPVSTCFLYLTPAVLALLCLLLQSSAVRAFTQQNLPVWGDWVAPSAATASAEGCAGGVRAGGVACADVGGSISYGGGTGASIPVTFASPLAVAPGAAAILAAALVGLSLFTTSFFSQGTFN